MTISSFAGPHRFLSNFWPVAVVYDGKSYRSVEHAYQAAKTVIPHERAAIQRALTPGDAKRLGKRVTMRADWSAVRIPAMHELLRQKFATEPLRGKLLATGKKPLVEGNYWGDRFWGVCDGAGENHMGRLLMEVRDELRR